MSDLREPGTVRSVAAVAVTLGGGILICVGVILVTFGIIFGLGGAWPYEPLKLLAFGIAAMGLGTVIVFLGPRLLSRG